MKRKGEEYFRYLHKIAMEREEITKEEVETLTRWPDLASCVKSHFDTHRGMARYHSITQKPVDFRSTERFVKSLERYCTTDVLRIQFVDALTKVVYKVPCGGVCDRAIKERGDLWHFYVSRSWRVFYRKKKNYILLEEFCPHKKLSYHRK